MSNTSKEKGDLLERVVGRLCSTITNAKTELNVKMLGTSGVLRQIDALVTGTVGAFEIRLIVDSKNHAAPVDINEVESMAGMVTDLGANLGVIVCPSGFTAGAKKRAESAGVQLYEVYDEALGNTSLLIPLRYIEARLTQYQFQISSTTTGPFSIPTDQSRWEFHIDGKSMSPSSVPHYLWNRGDIPQKAGEYVVTVGAVKMADKENTNAPQYCDLTVNVVVVEDYYLKLFPASFMKRAGDDDRRHFDLKLDVYSTKEDMLKNGWRYFETVEEMNAAADIENQPVGFQGLILRTEYSWGNKGDVPR